MLNNDNNAFFLKSLYITRIKFDHFEKIEKYYHDVFTFNKNCLKQKLTFRTILNFLGYSDSDYNNDQKIEIINEEIKKFLFYLYFIRIENQIKEYLADLKKILDVDLVNYYFVKICDLLCKTYFVDNKSLSKENYKILKSYVIKTIFNYDHITYAEKYYFLFYFYKIRNKSAKIYDRLLKNIDLLEQIKNNEFFINQKTTDIPNQITDFKRFENDIFYQSVFIFKNHEFYDEQQRERLLEALISKKILSYQSMFKIYITYYYKKIIMFKRFIEYIDAMIADYQKKIEDNNSKNSCYAKKFVGDVLEILKFLIKYNHFSMKRKFNKQIVEIIRRLYNSLYFYEKNVILKIINYYFRYYDNIDVFLNNFGEINHTNDIYYLKINNLIYLTIHNIFVLSKKDKKDLHVFFKIN